MLQLPGTIQWWVLFYPEQFFLTGHSQKNQSIFRRVKKMDCNLLPFPTIILSVRRINNGKKEHGCFYKGRHKQSLYRQVKELMPSQKKIQAVFLPVSLH